MKTIHKLPPPPSSLFDPNEFTHGHDLKAFFIGCALQGRIACEEAQVFEISKEDLVEWAYDVGERVFEKYAEENLSALRRFNKKVGI
jgi:hypothetical protein